jgi:putative colanic acid biosynthesis UDP-glucose lipid carrier transferase
MATRVGSRAYITHFRHVSRNKKKKKAKPRFSGIFFQTVKRLFDIVVSLLVITLVLSWLIPVLAILIKLDSGGPVFFVQTRIGFLGIPFRCYKLRTMVVNAESDSRQATDNDERITRLGHYLRLTSLDELPQFFNVLIGNMSIVGPRPFMKKDDQAFSIVISNYPLRYCAKPGITGMAQVKGYRGRTDNFFSIFHRYQWDAFYIRNARLALDMKIIRLTFRHIVKSIFSLKADTARLADVTKSKPDLSLSARQLALDNIR